MFPRTLTQPSIKVPQLKLSVKKLAAKAAKDSASQASASVPIGDAPSAAASSGSNAVRTRQHSASGIISSPSHHLLDARKKRYPFTNTLDWRAIRRLEYDAVREEAIQMGRDLSDDLMHHQLENFVTAHASSDGSVAQAGSEPPTVSVHPMRPQKRSWVPTAESPYPHPFPLPSICPSAPSPFVLSAMQGLAEMDLPHLLVGIFYCVLVLFLAKYSQLFEKAAAYGVEWCGH